MDIKRLKMINHVYFMIDWLSSHERYSDIENLIEILDFELAQKHANLNRDEIDNLKKSIEGWPFDRDQLKKAVAKIAAVYLSWQRIDKRKEKEDKMKTYVFFDVETTGLDSNVDQVIEIGAIKTDPQFREIGQIHTFVTLNEGTTIPKTIKEITGITEDNLKTGLLEQVALKTLDYFICDSIAVAHHAPFDLSFLSRLHGYIPIDKFICTRTVSKILFPHESASLSNMAQKFGLSLKNHHRALFDARLLKNLYKRLKSEMHKHGKRERDFINVLIETEERPVVYVPNDKTKIIRIDPIEHSAAV